jgi:hypothetical protein
VIRRYRRALSRYERFTVIVHTIDGGPSLQGVLMAVHCDCLVLAHAHHLDSKSPLDGEVIVPRGRVDWLQTVPFEEKTA